MIVGKQTVGRLPWLTFIVSVLIFWPASAWSAQRTGTETEDLMGLSLEELLRVNVTTFSRKPQALSKTPAAIFVISQSDIQRSGAKTIPDILRMAPGIEVAQLDANSWAVSARGSNGVFANKLLILMDGRTLYSPLYSGVYWEIQDTDLNSIERIEVIRGPGATMWGANAVNGVINIITKHAKDTQGTNIEVAAGNFTKFETTVSYGGEVGNAQFRTYAKYFDREGYADDNYDDWGFSRLGGRLDWSDQDNNRITMIGEIYAGDVGENILMNSATPFPPPAPPLTYSISENIDREFLGGFALLTWNRDLSETSDIQFRTYYDRNTIDDIAPEETRDTIDFDFQHHFNLANRHDIVWGSSYRYSEDQTTGSFTVSLDPEDRSHRLLSGFMQDEIRLSDSFYLTLGTKVEKSSFTDGLDWSPNVRMSWLMSENSTLWASVARAIRSPSRIEQNGRIVGIVIPPFPPSLPTDPPTAITINGSPQYGNEEVIAYEAGFRSHPFESMTFDLALFFNSYDGLRTGVSGMPVCQPSGAPAFPPIPSSCPPGTGFLEFPITFANQQDQNTYGLELALVYQAMEWWRLDGAYTFLKTDDLAPLPSSVGQDSPEHQLSIRSTMDLGDNTDFDLWLRYIDDLDSQGVDSYTALDMRLSYTPVPSVRLSIVGRNLIDSGHIEFVEEFGINQAVEIPREGYLEIQFQF